MGANVLEIFLHFSRPTLLRFPGTRRQQQHPWVIAPHVGYRRKGVAADGHRAAAAAAARLSSLFTIFDDSIISNRDANRFFIDCGSYSSLFSLFFSLLFWVSRPRERENNNRPIKIDNPFIFRFFFFSFPKLDTVGLGLAAGITVT